MYRILLALLITSLAACKKDDSAPDFHYDYFPTEKGRFVTYSVREVNIDDTLNINDTTEYFLKAMIGDTIIDNEGRVARRYNRYVSQSANGPWVLRDIWTAVLDGNKIELTEENQRTIKLVLAPDKYKEWNPNAYNMERALDCYYRNLHEPASVNGFFFDSTITVEQENLGNWVEFRRKYEQYAKGVGMYYKHYKDYEIKNYDTLNIKKGHELMMKLVDYGIE